MTVGHYFGKPHASALFSEKITDGHFSKTVQWTVLFFYSHSIVPGGFEVISYTTRVIPFTSFVILAETLAKNS